MGIICTWEPFVPGNQIYPGVLFAGALIQEPFCSGTLLPGALFAGTLFLGTRRFGGNVLVGTFWQELCCRSPNRSYPGLGRNQPDVVLLQ
jgi:hypothetical protein